MYRFFIFALPEKLPKILLWAKLAQFWNHCETSKTPQMFIANAQNFRILLTNHLHSLISQNKSENVDNRGVSVSKSRKQRKKIVKVFH